MKILNFFKRAKTSIAKEWQWPSLTGFFNTISNTSSGQAVNEENSLQVSAVYACVRLISNAIAMIPLQLHQQTYAKNKVISRLAIEKPLNNVLYRLANKNITSYLFKQAMQTQLLLYGNAYAEIVRNNKNEVIELHIIPSWVVTIAKEKGEKFYICKTDKNEIIFKENEIFHLVGLSFDGEKGYSPIQVMKEEIGLSRSIATFGNKYFKNGGNIGGFLEHPGRLGEVARKRLKEQWEQQHTGADNSSKTAILEEGLKYNKVGIPADDCQFIQSRKYQLEEICRYFGVQLHMIQNLDRATFNNIEQQNLEFKTYCLGPWLNVWENTIYKDLLNQQEQAQNFYAKFNINSLLKADYKTRMEGYRTGVQMGLYNLNEIRAFEDMNPLDTEGGDTHFINAAMIPIDQNQNSGNSEGGDEN
jgi:HK97 family phage portal protein